MAPPRLYRPPHEQLIELLEEARAQGLDFVTAWNRAFRPGQPVVMTTTKGAPEGALRWPTDSRERLEWQAVLASLRDPIRRAYERRPATRRESSVVVLVRVLDEAPQEGTPAVGEGHGIASLAAVRSAA